ncbi:MAG TPA: hypothetical protein VGL94_04310 [Ktedonobacteraceae bacterium]|jgi:hypothetical protein
MKFSLLRAERRRRGWSQTTVAEALGSWYPILVAHLLYTMACLGQAQHKSDYVLLTMVRYRHHSIFEKSCYGLADRITAGSEGESRV